MSGSVVMIVALAYRDTLENLTEAEKRRDLLAQELRHRGKNSYAIISAVIAQTLGRESPQIAIINKRLSALLRSNDQLSQQGTAETLATVIESEVDAHKSGRLILEGPSVTLSPEDTRIIALMAHESATNALKYGALATEHGYIRVSWTKQCDTLKITWSEHGGRVVKCASRDGFGTRFLKEIFAQARGNFERVHSETGVIISATLPLKESSE
jgi:two-component sensor histidine kinase